MRNIPKNDAPEVLVQKCQVWHDEYHSNPSEHNRTKYRHPAIKSALMEETRGKCAYCESKVGHNCPGDVEHKIPVVHRQDLLFAWENMTIACTECNRRKSNYFDPQCMFLDPNSDDVESKLQHVGPLVFSRPGHVRAEVTIRLLELDRPDARRHLIGRKFDKLEEIRNLVERIATESNNVVKQFLLRELDERCSASGEFSAMVKAYVAGLPTEWTHQTESHVT